MRGSRSPGSGRTGIVMLLWGLTITASSRLAAQEGGVELTQEEQARVEELIAEVKNDRFPIREVGREENARIYLYLADTSTDRAVLRASLEGLARTWTFDPRLKRKLVVDDDYRRVVRRHLTTEDLISLERAIMAAKQVVCGETPDREAVRLLTGIAAEHPSPIARLDAARCLWNLEGFQADEGIAAAYLRGLRSDDPVLIAGTLIRLDGRTHRLAHREEFLARILELIDHEDPGIRGRSAWLAAWMVGEEEEEALGERVHALMDDEHPYVRATAAMAVSRLQRLASIHKVITLLDDTEKCTHEVAYESLSGTQEWIRHNATPRSTVQAAVLTVLPVMSRDLGEHRFRLGKIEHSRWQEDMAREADRARAWYEENLDAFPAE